MNVVDRQISAAATAMTSCVLDVGSRKMNGCSSTPTPSRIVLRYPRSVKIADHAMPAARSEIASGSRKM